MAFHAEMSRSELNGVTASSRLFDPVNDVLDSLNRKVLWESAKGATGLPLGCQGPLHLVNEASVRVETLGFFLNTELSEFFPLTVDVDGA